MNTTAYFLILTTAVVVLVLVQGFKLDTESRWEAFKIEFGKKYDTEEEKLRFSAFSRNIESMEQHNSEAEAGKFTYRLGIHEFSDMDTSEAIATLNGLSKPKLDPQNMPCSKYLSPSNLARLPDMVDWRDAGFVTHVKNQGRCGSCWAFSTTGVLEGQNAKVKGQLVSLSEQQLVDCDSTNYGCNGGWPSNALAYIQKNGGIDTEQSYPYTSGDGKNGTCQFNPNTVGATDTGCIQVTSTDESALQEAVANVGPISVLIDAADGGFMNYQSGVYVSDECNAEDLDHAVLVVGYGTDPESGLDYWLVKNSWGTSWGEQGYVRMARNRNNMCGIASVAVYPLM